MLEAYDIRKKEMNIALNNIIKIMTINRTVLINDQISELL